MTSKPLQLEVGDRVDWNGWEGEVIQFLTLGQSRVKFLQGRYRVLFARPAQEFFFLADGRMSVWQRSPVLKLISRSTINTETKS